MFMAMASCCPQWMNQSAFPQKDFNWLPLLQSVSFLLRRAWVLGKMSGGLP
jgi:hypothetical protein